jgi:hypothetical protein
MSDKSSIKKSVEKVYHLDNSVYTPSSLLQCKYKDNKYVEFRNLFVRTYCKADVIERLIESIDPDEYAFILHDKDIQPDGSPKMPHYHLLISKRSGIRLTPFIKACDENTHISVANSKTFCYEYLTHKNNPEKFAYSSSDVREFHRDVDTYSATTKERYESTYSQMLDDINTLSRRDMAIKYGRDYMLNYQRYEAFKTVVEDEEASRANADVIKTFNTSNKVTDNVTIVDNNSGDFLRLTVADFLVSEMSKEISKSGVLPSERDILKWYRRLCFDILQARKDRRPIDVYTEVSSYEK